jgi:chromosome segregation ATPase
MTIIDIESAIRAYKDRPSMELELQELREAVDLIAKTNRSMGEQLASYDGQFAAMAETIERTKMELIQTAQARDEAREKWLEHEGRVACLQTELDDMKTALIEDVNAGDSLRDQLAATEKARDYHIEQTTQLREEVKRLRGALREVVAEISGDRRYGRCIYCGNGANIARAALSKKGE